MGVATSRAAAHVERRVAAAAPTRLLDLPDAVLERILVAASDGGKWHRMRFLDDELEEFALLPRLGALKQLYLTLYWNGRGSSTKCFGDMSDKIAQAVRQHCQGVTELFMDPDEYTALLPIMARALGIVGDGRLGGEVLPVLPRLSSLSLDWPGYLDVSLAPLARWTRLAKLELCGYATGVMETDWLPPNLEELHLSAHAVASNLRGIGGAGWLAALHVGACPRLRSMRLVDLAVRDVRPGGEWQGVTLANTLPRLTALQQLVMTAFESTDVYAFGEPDDVDDDDGFPEYARPIPAARLLAAMPALRHCQAGFVPSRYDRWGQEYRVWTFGEDLADEYRSTTPMLLATPAELAALRAPRLESLSLGLVTSSNVKDKAWRCSGYEYEDVGDNDTLPASAAAPAPVSSPIGDLLALQSMELRVGCRCAVDGAGSLWDLSALPPGSLPALRRLLVLPISFGCSTAKLPLGALARAAPGLERLAIDPRCAGSLAELFCTGGCALSLRSLVVLPPPRRDATAPARLYAELCFGLRARAAAAAGAAGRRSGNAVPHMNVTLLQAPDGESGGDEDDGVAAEPPYSICGATVALRPFRRYMDDFYLDDLRPPPARSQRVDRGACRKVRARAPAQQSALEGGR